MRKNKVFKIPSRDSDDEVLIYVPSLFRLGVVSREESEDLPEYISTDGDLALDDASFPFPPIFNSLTLHLSSACNMSCTYCYNGQNAQSCHLSAKQVENSIDYLLDHPRDKKLKIHFMGGEPTVAWESLQHAVDYAREAVSNRDTEIIFAITSNGVWSDAQYEYIINNISDITISIDGPEDVHNKYRKLKSGRNTYEHVFRVAKALNDIDTLNLCLSVTMAREFVERMRSITEFLCREFPGVDIFIEALRTDNQHSNDAIVLSPDIKIFLDNYIDCLSYLRKAGFSNDISNSFVKPCGEQRTRYCGASGGNFIVSPDGIITACGAMTYNKSPVSNYFSFGEVHDSGILLDEDKYRRLVEWNVSNIEECNDCIARYICLGGCLARKAHLESFWSRPSCYCKEIRDAAPSYLWNQYMELAGG